MPRIKNINHEDVSTMVPSEIKVDIDLKSTKKSHAPIKRAPSKKVIRMRRQQSLSKENCGTVAAFEKRRQSAALTIGKKAILLAEQ